jgi:hypothetical protein
MNAENGTGIQKWYFIYSTKQREIKPLSSIFSNLSKLSPLIFFKITHREMCLYKNHVLFPTSPPPQNCVVVLQE